MPQKKKRRKKTLSSESSTTSVASTDNEHFKKPKKKKKKKTTSIIDSGTASAASTDDEHFEKPQKKKRKKSKTSSDSGSASVTSTDKVFLKQTKKISASSSAASTDNEHLKKERKTRTSSDSDKASVASTDKELPKKTKKKETSESSSTASTDNEHLKKPQKKKRTKTTTTSDSDKVSVANTDKELPQKTKKKKTSESSSTASAHKKLPKKAKKKSESSSGTERSKSKDAKSKIAKKTDPNKKKPLLNIKSNKALSLLSFGSIPCSPKTKNKKMQKDKHQKGGKKITDDKLPEKRKTRSLEPQVLKMPELVSPPKTQIERKKKKSDSSTDTQKSKSKEAKVTPVKGTLSTANGPLTTSQTIVQTLKIPEPRSPSKTPRKRKTEKSDSSTDGERSKRKEAKSATVKGADLTGSKTKKTSQSPSSTSSKATSSPTSSDISSDRKLKKKHEAPRAASAEKFPEGKLRIKLKTTAQKVRAKISTDKIDNLVKTDSKTSIPQIDKKGLKSKQGKHENVETTDSLSQSELSSFENVPKRILKKKTEALSPTKMKKSVVRFDDLDLQEIVDAAELTAVPDTDKIKNEIERLQILTKDVVEKTPQADTLLGIEASNVEPVGDTLMKKDGLKTISMPLSGTEESDAEPAGEALIKTDDIKTISMLSSGTEESDAEPAGEALIKKDNIKTISMLSSGTEESDAEPAGDTLMKNEGLKTIPVLSPDTELSGVDPAGFRTMENEGLKTISGLSRDIETSDAELAETDSERRFEPLLFDNAIRKPVETSLFENSIARLLEIGRHVISQLRQSGIGETLNAGDEPPKALSKEQLFLRSSQDISCKNAVSHLVDFATLTDHQQQLRQESKLKKHELSAPSLGAFFKATDGKSFQKLPNQMTSKNDQQKSETPIRQSDKSIYQCETCFRKIDVGEAGDQYSQFGQHVASQLRELPVRRFIILQEKIQQLITEERLRDIEKTPIPHPSSHDSIKTNDDADNCDKHNQLRKQETSQLAKLPKRNFCLNRERIKEVDQLLEKTDLCSCAPYPSSSNNNEAQVLFSSSKSSNKTQAPCSLPINIGQILAIYSSPINIDHAPFSRHNASIVHQPCIKIICTLQSYCICNE